MVHGFIKQSGGQMVLDSEPGRGTRVHLYFPHAPRRINVPRARAEVAEVPHGTESILLVEDEALVRQTVSAMLSGLGYRVTEAVDGPSAVLATNGSGSFDLVLTDVMMPGGMTGLDLATTLWQTKPFLPIVFTTGYSADLIDQNPELKERVRILTKPYIKRELALCLRQVLDAAA
jgi:CheY-like chemotaxis protein